MGLVEVDSREEKGERSSSQWPLGPQVCGLGGFGRSVKWVVRVGARCAVVVEGGWKSGRRKRRLPRVWDILGLGF